MNEYFRLEFVVELFDSSRDQFESLKSGPAVIQVIAFESTTLLEDPMVALEQDHKKLSLTVDLNNVVQAEFDEYHANGQTEGSFIISGVPWISGHICGKEWLD